MDEKLALNLESSMVDFLVSFLQVLAEDNQREIVEFCKQEGLVLLADEVMDCFFLFLMINFNYFQTLWEYC